MKNKKKKFPFKIIIFLVIISLGLYFSAKGLWHFFLTSGYFEVKNIISGNQSVDLTYLQGENIFTLDLKGLADKLIVKYPNQRMIRLIRYLPNAIGVEFIERKPLAYVKLYRYFAVDEEMVLFSVEDSELNPNLPIIFGLQTKIFGPKSGKRYQVKELRLALDLISEVGKVKELRDYKIIKINAEEAGSLSFFILKNIEIKIGQDIRNKLRIFKSLLPHIRSELDRIRYIDFRFREPAIKYK